MNAAQHILIFGVRCYRYVLSPAKDLVFGPLGRCRFTPSCSEYMIQAITAYGVVRGVGKGLWRLLRCQPFCKGGYDPVVPEREFKMLNAECRMQNDAEYVSASSAVRK